MAVINHPCSVLGVRETRRLPTFFASRERVLDHSDSRMRRAAEAFASLAPEGL